MLWCFTRGAAQMTTVAVVRPINPAGAVEMWSSDVAKPSWLMGKADAGETPDD